MSTFNDAKEGLSLTAVIGTILILTCLIINAFNFGLLNPPLQLIIFSWPILLILLSLIGFARRDKVVPLLLLLVGVFFLIPRIESVYPGILNGVGNDFVSKYWHFLLIVAGLILIIGIVVNKLKTDFFTEETYH